MSEIKDYKIAEPTLTREGFSGNHELVVRALRDNGYNVQETRFGDYSGINILSPRQSPGRIERLLGFAGIKFGPAAYHIGTLWVDNKPKGATDSTMVLESNGVDHVGRISTLVTDLLSGKDVSVEVKLSKSSPDLVRLSKGYSLN